MVLNGVNYVSQSWAQEAEVQVSLPVVKTELPAVTSLGNPALSFSGNIPEI